MRLIFSVTQQTTGIIIVHSLSENTREQRAEFVFYLLCVYCMCVFQKLQSTRLLYKDVSNISTLYCKYLLSSGVPRNIR